MESQPHIDTLSSGLPRAVIEAAFVIMLLAAVCSCVPVNTWMLSHIPVTTGLINTLGMVVLYYAILRGMKGLSHPLTVLWWIAIGMNLLGFILYCFGEAASGVSAVVATTLPIIYLPLGILLIVWYRGNLCQVGIWMIVRILVVNLVPVLFYVSGLMEHNWGITVMDVITIGVEIWYAWTLRSVLVN